MAKAIPFNRLQAPYQPAGDQPEAIEQLVRGIEAGDRCQTLLGVTGSGKTFTMAAAIARLNRPALVFAPNKTLALKFFTGFRASFLNLIVERADADIQPLRLFFAATVIIGG